MDVTILANQSLSTPIDLGEATLVSFSMPSAWTAGNLTFQASDSLDGTYKDVYDSTGSELVVTASSNRVICDIPEIAALRFIKVRSGTSASPAPQGANRVIRVFVK